MDTSEAMARGQRHQDNGEFAEAEAVYRQISQTNPGDLNALYRLAVVCQLQGRATEAISFYQQLLRVKPDSAKVHNNLGLALAALNRQGEAIASYEQAIHFQPNFAEAFNNLGNVRTATDHWEQAIDAYRQALALKSNYAAAWNNLGRAQLHLENWHEAVRCFQQAVALQPNNALALNQLGNALFEQGKFDEAGERYREAARIQPDYAEAHYNLSRVLRLQSRWEEAALCLQRSLQINPNSALANAALADIYYGNLNRFGDALVHYRRVLALKPDDRKAQLLVEALTGGSRLEEVPAEYVAAVYESLAPRFDQMVGRRGDCSPQWLKSALGGPPPPASLDILDLGCGTGLCGLQFRSWARTLIGVDLSPAMLAQAQVRGIYDELIQSDLLSAMQNRSGAFDLILASDVLLYVGNLAPIFEAVRRALRPGGRFAFTVDLLRDGPDYRLTPWIHFAHSRRYLERLANETSMREIAEQDVVFPREDGLHANGLVVVLNR
jgi:predicted TPR repeat methyltransferase